MLWPTKINPDIGIGTYGWIGPIQPVATFTLLVILIRKGLATNVASRNVQDI